MKYLKVVFLLLMVSIFVACSKKDEDKMDKKTTEFVEDVKETVKDAKEKIDEAIDKDDLDDSVDETTDKVKKGVDEATDDIKKGMDKVMDEVEEVEDDAEEVIEKTKEKTGEEWEEIKNKVNEDVDGASNEVNKDVTSVEVTMSRQNYDFLDTVECHEQESFRDVTVYTASDDVVLEEVIQRQITYGCGEQVENDQLIVKHEPQATIRVEMSRNTSFQPSSYQTARVLTTCQDAKVEKYSAGWFFFDKKDITLQVTANPADVSRALVLPGENKILYTFYNYYCNSEKVLSGDQECLEDSAYLERGVYQFNVIVERTQLEDSVKKSCKNKKSQSV